MQRRSSKFPKARLACLLAAFLLFEPGGGFAETIVFSPVEANGSKTYVPPLIGANVHYGDKRILGYFSVDKVIQQLRDIGAATFRDYIIWQSFKFTKDGTPFYKQRRLMGLLEKPTGMRPLINLGYANSFVEGGIPPLTDKGLELYKAFVKKAVEITGSYSPIYEVWNEWNMWIGVGKHMPALDGAGAADDPRAAIHYTRVAKAAIKTIRAVDPNASILVGAVGDDSDWGWARGIVRDGVLDGADGLSVHLYNQCARTKTPNEMVQRVSRLQALLTKDRGGTQTPIYITEFGWPTSDGNCGMPLDQTGRYFAQFILQASALPWIKGIWMHELKNITPDPVDRESNFGLYFYDDKPKPAVCFMREATQIIRSADLVEVKQPYADIFVARIKSGLREKIIFWASNEGSSATYQLSPTINHGQTMCGDTVENDGKPLSFRTAPVIFDANAGDKIVVKLTR